MSTTALDAALGAALDDAIADLDDSDRAAVTAANRPPAFVSALPASSLFADPAYQRPLDDLRVQRMAEDFDVSLLGIVEVSDRGDGRYALIDGQHRWAVVREVNGPDTPMVCNVHRGLGPEDEARLFYELDRTRRHLTGWDRWWARRGAGEDAVLDIERVLAGHDLRVAPNTTDGVVRATKACENVVDLGGLELLDQAVGVLLAAWGQAADALDGAHIEGMGLVLHHYDVGEELDLERLTTALQGIAPRQVKARAGLLREAHRGLIPRLVAAVMVERYNASKGRRVDEFLVRVPSVTKSKRKRDAKARRDDAIRAWARRNDTSLASDGWRIPRAVREAYDAAHPAVTS